MAHVAITILLFAWQPSQKALDERSKVLVPYLDIITEYREGEPEAATKELAAWPETRVNDTIERLRMSKGAYETLSPFNPSGVRPSMPYWLLKLVADDYIQAAVMLHTDVAFRPGERPLDASGEYHLGIAQRLSEMIEDEPQRYSFQRDWFLTIGYYYQSMLVSFRAIDYFEKALNLTPEDGELLLAMGTAQETLGRKFRNTVERSDETSRFERESQIRQRDHLKKTRALFEKALKVDPTLLEARLRLGHIQHRLGNDKEALQQLRQCSIEAREPRLKFLSHLFLGEVLEAQGQTQEAIEAYRVAHETNPQSPVGSLALSHALHVVGERRSALDALTDGLSDTPPRHDDPWWRYPFGRSGQLEPMLDQMRQDVLF